MRTRIVYFFAALVLTLAASASAANLIRLLPQETLLAAGVEGLSAHEARFQVFIDEWQRLDLGNLLTAAFGEEGLTDEVPEALEDVGILDLLGNEAWLAVSMSSFNPMPAFTAVATLSPRAVALAQEAIAEEAASGNAQSFTEGNVTFWLLNAGGQDPFSDPPLAVAQVDDLFTISTNPDVLRGVLRRYQGASEASLADAPGFSATTGALGTGNLYLYLDLPAAARAAAPFASGMGFDSLLQRLIAALNTAGTYGAVNYITNSGMEGRSLRLMGDASQDPTLYRLVAGPQVLSEASLAFVPAGAIGYQGMQLDLPGWWRWLGEVLASAPDLGIDDLDEMLEMTIGIDPQQLLFGWMASEAAVVTLAGAAPSQIGMAMENPLGDTAYLIEVGNEAAAAAGLSQLMMTATGMLGAFVDPMGQGGFTPPSTRSVAGVEVSDWTVGGMFSLSTAVTGGYAILATTPATMDAVLTARQQGGGLPASFAPLRARVPAGARMVGFSNDQASMRELAATMVEQIGMVAGLTGGAIDFDATERASQAVSEFLEFVAGRLGSSVSYAIVDGTRVRGESFSEIIW